MVRRFSNSDFTGKLTAFSPPSARRSPAWRSVHLTPAQHRNVPRFSACPNRLTFGYMTAIWPRSPENSMLCFTKSVLVTTDLQIMLTAIRRKLRPGGRFASIENANGGHLASALLHAASIDVSPRALLHSHK